MPQAIELNEGADGWHWLDQLLNRSVLALELLTRQPVEACIALAPTQTRPPGCTRGDYHARMVLTLEERSTISEKLLTAVRQAAGERLMYSEICSRAGVEFTQTTRRILQLHIDARQIETEGRGRAAVYWAKRGKP